MRLVCAWCGAFIREVPEDSSFAGPLDSHGICEGCARTLLEGLGIPLDQFLSGLGAPVLVVSDDAQVVDANPAALATLGATGGAVAGRMVGQVFECVNSRLPGGCGRTVHCSGCVLRRTVTSTWETGRPHARIPATLEVTSRGDPGEIALLVSTAKVGDRVLLRFDPPGGEEARVEGR